MKNRIKNIANKSLIIEFLFIILIIFTFDLVFILRYGFGVSLGHWLVAFFNVAIIISTLSFIKKNRRRYTAYFIYILVMFSFFLSDSTLYFYKQDVTSIAMLLESGKNTMKIGIKYNPLTPYGIFVWSLIIAFLVITLKLLKKIVYLHNENRPKRYTNRTLYFMVSVLGLMFSPAVINANDFLTFSTPADKTLFVQKFGSITYHSKDIITFASNAIKPLLYAEEYAIIIDETVTDSIASQSELFGLLEGHNVIMIMMETAEQYGFDPTLTPNYYRLKEEGIYFDTFYSAAKSNYTYDAEFKSLTSMMYFQADNFMYTFGNNTYHNALPYVLSQFGYRSNSYHNYYKSFFNRNVIHPNMGFENYYAVEDLEIEEQTFWPLDSLMFDQFKDLIAPVQDDPFFSFIMSVTAHGPHKEYRKELQEYYDILAQDPRYDDAELELLTITAAQMELDKGLGILLDDLESKNLLDTTMIILFSDHKNYSSYDITHKYTENSDIPFEVEKVPFVIYSKLLGSGIDSTLSSTYDITPTIMDLLGISYYQDFYYGQSVFLDERLDLPIILAHSSWISHEMTVQFENVVAGSNDIARFNETRTWIFNVIDTYEKMFQSDYFNNRQTFVPQT